MHLNHVSTMDTEERSAISNGIKIRHRSRCLRPSVWPTPAADNRLPVRWTRAVDTNHTAPKRCDRSQNGPGALSGLLCVIGGFAPPVAHTGATPCGAGAVHLGGTEGKQGTSYVSVSQIPWYYYSIFKWGFPGSKSQHRSQRFCDDGA